MKYAYSGSHGTGKSTSVMKKVLELKMEYRDKEVVPFIENARKAPARINRKADEMTQLWIFANQIQEEVYLEKLYPIIVCDRTVMDSVAYTKYNRYKIWKSMYELAKDFIKTYDVIYFKSVEKNDYLFEDGVRDLDVNYRLAIENILLGMYEESGAKVEYE